MNLQHAKLIVDAAQNSGKELNLHEEYSGRGMCGKTTAGVVGPLMHIVESIAVAAYELGRDEEIGSRIVPEDEESVEEGVSGEEFLEEMSRLKFDSMGYNSIIY